MTTPFTVECRDSVLYFDRTPLFFQYIQNPEFILTFIYKKNTRQHFSKKLVKIWNLFSGHYMEDY